MSKSYTKTMERIIAKMTAENLVLRVAGAGEVFVDIDDSLDTIGAGEKIERVHKLFKAVSYATFMVSKGGNGLHIKVVMVEPISDTERTTIALSIGSDPVRELLRLRAIRDKTDDVPAIFLDKPDAVEHRFPIEFKPYQKEQASEPTDTTASGDTVQGTATEPADDINPGVEPAADDDVQSVSPEPESVARC